MAPITIASWHFLTDEPPLLFLQQIEGHWVADPAWESCLVLLCWVTLSSCAKDFAWRCRILTFYSCWWVDLNSFMWLLSHTCFPLFMGFRVFCRSWNAVTPFLCTSPIGEIRGWGEISVISFFVCWEGSGQFGEVSLFPYNPQGASSVRWACPLPAISIACSLCPAALFLRNL